MRLLRVSALIGLVLGEVIGVASSPAHAARRIKEFPIPTAGALPWAITAGPGGNLWFTEREANKISRITPSGVITEFPVPTPAALPWGITAGPDGNVWFVDQ